MAGLLRRAVVPAVEKLRTSLSQSIAPRALQAMSTHVGTGSGGRCGGWAVRGPPDDIPYAVKGLRHIAIAVPDLAAAAEHYRNSFGAQVSDPVDFVVGFFSKRLPVAPKVLKEVYEVQTSRRELKRNLQDHPDHGVTKIYVQLPNMCIELLHPLGKESPVANFLQKNPKGGIHHFCLAVDDLQSAAGYLGEAGVNRIGAKSAVFLHPKDNMGVLIELQQANYQHVRYELPRAVGM